MDATKGRKGSRRIAVNGDVRKAGDAVMEARYFAIVQALVRHALYALADLPKDHPQRGPLRWQVQRLENELRAGGDADRADKIGRLGKWFDDGAVVSTDMVVLSEAEPASESYDESPTDPHHGGKIWV